MIPQNLELKKKKIKKKSSFLPQVSFKTSSKTTKYVSVLLKFNLIILTLLSMSKEVKLQKQANNLLNKVNQKIGKSNFT